MPLTLNPADLHSRKVPPDEIAPREGAGVYAYYVRDAVCLPGLKPGTEGLIYVGMTEQGLDAREHAQHKHSGFSTLRRSLGALLKEELKLTALPRSAGKSASNIRCFRFHDDGERALSKWMRDNLLCSQVEISCGVVELEAVLITASEPPLNLKGWRNPQAPHVRALRAQCASEAKRAASLASSQER